jgi:hypothetical protein
MIVRTIMTVPVAAAAAAFLALGAVTACSSAAPPGTAPAPQIGASHASAVPPAPAARTDSRACALAPAAEVGKALKLPLRQVVGTVEGPVTVCAYTGRYEVMVRFQQGENAAEFAASRHNTTQLHQLTNAVAGLGSGAYLATYTLAKPPENTLAARHGRVAIFITSPAPLASERKLMRRLLARG